MADKVFILDFMQQYFDELLPKEFYREIFPAGELEEQHQQRKGKYNAIAVELLPQEQGRENAKRHLISDELHAIDELLHSENFVIVSPISYIGKSRQAKNARFIYALAIDLDGVDTKEHLQDLFHQIENDVLPRPTYIVFSGNGLHLYYRFIKPLPCFNNITKQLSDYKSALTKRIWNKYITTQYEKPQIQSLFQGFRMVGSKTKSGSSRTRAFRTGEPVDIEYLNQYVAAEHRIKEFVYKSKMTLEEAAEKYPEWYEQRIENKKPKGTWTCKRDLYEWWKNKLKWEIREGHRYYGIMCLCAYAKKCGIEREELEADAFGMLQEMESLTISEDNHFTREDILAALEMYNDNYITFPIHAISTLTNIPIEKNKRNGRKQAEHIKLMNFIREEINGNKEWQGRKSKEDIVQEWQRKNPGGTKAKCIKETGLSKPTVYKHWKGEEVK